MPSYKKHVKVNLFVALPLLTLGIKSSIQPTFSELVIFLLSFLYGTFFLHPDLDLARKIKLFSLKGVLSLPFRPLSYFMKHRGISHAPVIGTLIRISWLLFLFSLLTPLFKPICWNFFYIGYGILGLIFSDVSHILLDKFYSKKSL